MLAQDSEGFTELAMASSSDQPQRHNLYVEFFAHSRQDSQKSLAEGRPIFKDVDYVRIMVPGDKSSIIERPVRLGHAPQHDNIRFAPQYRAYKERREQVLEGTPLSEWPLITKSHVNELAHYKIKTVEQLASVPDSVAQNFRGITRLRQQAAAYMESAKGAAPVAQMQAQLDEMKQKNEFLQKQLTEVLEGMKAQKETPATAVANSPLDEDPDIQGSETDTPDTPDTPEAAKAPARKSRRRTVNAE